MSWKRNKYLWLVAMHDMTLERKREREIKNKEKKMALALALGSGLFVYGKIPLVGRRRGFSVSVYIYI